MAQATATCTVLGRSGAYPAPGGAGRGYLLDAGTGEPAVLLGCGSGVVGRLGYHLSGPGALGPVLLPDLRPDHASDLWSLGSLAAAAAAAARRRGLLQVYAYQDPPDLWRGLARPGVLDVRRFGAADVVRAAGWHFSFTTALHPWPGVAVRAEVPGGPAFGFVGLGAPSLDLRALLQGVGLLVVEVGGPRDGEGLGLDEGLAGGMAAGAAAALAAGCGAGRLLLAHLDAGEDAAWLLAEARAVRADATLALEGRTYEVT